MTTNDDADPDAPRKDRDRSDAEDEHTEAEPGQDAPEATDRKGDEGAGDGDGVEGRRQATPEEILRAVEVEEAKQAEKAEEGAEDAEVVDDVDAVLDEEARRRGGAERLLDERVPADRTADQSGDDEPGRTRREPPGPPAPAEPAEQRLDKAVSKARMETRRDEIRRAVGATPVEERIRTPDIEIDRPDLQDAPEDYLDLPEFEPARDRGKGRGGEATGGLLGRVAGVLSGSRGGQATDERGDAREGGGPGAGGVQGHGGRRGERGHRPQYAPDGDEAQPGEPLVYLPRLRGDQHEEALYTIVDGYLYVRILWDDRIKEHVYQVLEPDLSRREKAVYRFVKETLVNTLDVDVSEMEREGLERYLRERMDDVLYEYSLELPPDSERKLKYYVVRDFLGYGKIDVLMRDPLIEDISCDGPGIPVFIYHRKFESMKTNIVYDADEELDSFVIKLAQKCRKHISIADPVLDATMPDGSRLQTTLGREVTTGGSTFTIRKFREDPLTPTTLIDYGTFDEDIVAYFWLAVQHGKSTIFAGGTASGKTTSLNSILLFIPPQMKIVSIEDTRELNLPHPNWIAGVTREGGALSHREGAGEIDMYTLLREALRQRPEYIVVGEVRGDEAYTLFQAMATGHTTYSTMHADSVESAIHRLNNDPINVPKIMLKALDIVSVQVQTRVGGHRVRRCKQVVEVVGVDPHTDEILTNEVFRWVPADDAFEATGVSYVLEKIKHEKSMSDREMSEELERRKAILRWMRRHDVKDYQDVARVVTSYYKDPETTMARVRQDMEVRAVTRGVAKALEDRPDAAPGAGSEVGSDAGSKAGPDAGSKAGSKAGPEAGSDAGSDAGSKAGPDGEPAELVAEGDADGA